MKKTLLAFILIAGIDAFAQKNNETVDPKAFQALKWRNIGPFRGGRSLAVSGVVSDRQTYYFGATGGGVWKSTDGGTNWTSVSDTTFKSSSVGAIAVAPSNANIVYVGMGEGDIRGNISFGDGIYKSTTGGKSWTHMGLKKSDAINAIQVHPFNPDIVYVSALGNPFGRNPERGIYKTIDGGKNWNLILYKNDSTGATDIKMDPSNPDILYASMWTGYRTPHGMNSGGTENGLFKSTDAGATWQSLSQKPGMPVGLIGKIGVAVSPVNASRVWAMVENAEKGGLFKSDNGGESWTQVSEDKNIRQRPWYYSMIHADPKNIDGLIVTNVNLLQTTDGGKTFKRINVHHGDNHDLWWNPADPLNYIVADDGGAEVTFDGGENFSDIDFPTAQFYHVTVDNEFPYNVYGAQQDNSSVRIASRTKGASIGPDAWFPVAGGEAGYIVSDPLNANITYGGEYDGQMTKYDKSIDQTQDISVYPESNMGFSVAEKKLRFQWTYPIVFSPHDPKRIFVGSQFVHTSIDGGQSWETISPDLTTNAKDRQVSSGGPITKDNTGAEAYCTVFTFGESPFEKGVYWAGSDDGLLHVSKDAGKTWQNVTPSEKQLPKFSLISLLDVSSFSSGTCYVAATGYRSGNRTPYILKTNDYGKTWKAITKGIPSDEYVRVVRHDPLKKGVLYAGTERGIWVSFNDGEQWQKLQQNLPISPVHDIQIQKNFKDLVIATHGRAFWILDDISPIHQLADNMALNKASLFKPSKTYRLASGQYGRGVRHGQNPAYGAKFRYFLPEKPKGEVKLLIKSASGDTIVQISDRKNLEGKELKLDKSFYQDLDKTPNGYLSTKVGQNEFVWGLNYPAPPAVDGTNVMWSGGLSGATALPGMYSVSLYIDGQLQSTETFEIAKDPRISTTEADFKDQFELTKKINDQIKQVHQNINQTKKARKLMTAFPSNIIDTAKADIIKKMIDPVSKMLDAIEGELMQPKALAGQDLLAVPIHLNDKLNALIGTVNSADTKPTKGSYQVFDDLVQKVAVQQLKLKEVFEKFIPQINAKLIELKVPHIPED